MLDSLVIKKYKFKNFTIPQLAGDMGLSYEAGGPGQGESPNDSGEIHQ